MFALWYTFSLQIRMHCIQAHKYVRVICIHGLAQRDKLSTMHIAHASSHIYCIPTISNVHAKCIPIQLLFAKLSNHISASKHMRLAKLLVARFPRTGYTRKRLQYSRSLFLWPNKRKSQLLLFACLLFLCCTSFLLNVEAPRVRHTEQTKNKPNS